MSTHKTYWDTVQMQEWDDLPGAIRPGTDISARIAQGGLVLLGPGEYTISEQVVIEYPTKLCLRGAGMQQTIINCTAGITFNTDDVDDYSLVNWSHFQDLTFFGPVNRTIDCFTVSWASRLYWQNVEIRRFRQALDAQRLWDAEFLNCSIVNCGTSLLAAIELARLENPDLGATTTNSNNVCFTNTHFEPTLGVGLKLGDGTCGCRIMGCKFHGDLPTPLAYDHLQLASGSYCNMIVGNSFINCGASGITIDDSDGNSIIGNRFGACEAGITFSNSPADNAVVGNNFGIGAGGHNTADIVGDTTGNEVANNPGA